MISTASGNKFARDAKDWKWWHAKVPNRIRELNDEGYVYFPIGAPITLAIYLRYGDLANMRSRFTATKSLSSRTRSASVSRAS